MITMRDIQSMREDAMATRDFEADDGSILIGMLACTLSGAIVGCIAGAMGAILFIVW